MTEPTIPDDDQVDEDLDTTDGDRDPLSTEDGIAEASEGMPAVEERDESGSDQLYRTDDGEAVDVSTIQPPVRAPGLEIDEDGTDPLVDEPNDEV